MKGFCRVLEQMDIKDGKMDVVESQGTVFSKACFLCCSSSDKHLFGVEKEKKKKEKKRKVTRALLDKGPLGEQWI